MVQFQATMVQLIGQETLALLLHSNGNLIATVDALLLVRFVNCQATLSQIRSRESPNLEVGGLVPAHDRNYFLWLLFIFF